MERVVIVEPDSPHYDAALAFAFKNFITRHNCSLVIRPNILAIIYKDDCIVGTMGLITTCEEPYYFEQSKPKGASTKLFGNPSRTSIAELTRFTVQEGVSPRTAFRYGTKLAACLCAYAYKHNIRHFGFVGKKSFRSMFDALGIHTFIIGEPIFDLVPPELLGTYLEQQNVCAIGFSLTAAPVIPSDACAPLEVV